MATQQELTQQQQAVWGAAATGWERHAAWFERNSRPLSEWMCDAARLAPGHAVLDLACGAGLPATVAAARVHPGGRVVATDVAPEMVEVTRRKVAREGLDNVEVREMDAQAIGFPEASFDAVTCRFGLMFCPDPVLAAREVRRVLKPGGRFALAVWDEASRNEVFTAVAKAVEPFLPPAPPPDPTAPGPFRLGPPGELERVLRAAGFSDLAVETRPMTWAYGSLEEYWAIHIDLSAPLKAAVAKLSPDVAARLKAADIGAVAPFARADGAVHIEVYPICAWAAK